MRPKSRLRRSQRNQTNQRASGAVAARSWQNLAKVLLRGVSRNTILAAVENLDVGAIIIGLLRSEREQTRLEALHFIFDRVMGKPKQDLSVTG